jgi:N-acetylglucosaminyl-diphospho-decaprenol L-rhamnosyltransferase
MSQGPGLLDKGRAAIHVSVVSHGHGALLRDLLSDLSQRASIALEITITLNVPESLTFEPRDIPLPVTIVENTCPRGFGANHNAAFARSSPSEGYFCVVNPDVRLGPGVLVRLVETLCAHPSAAVVAPRVRDQAGRVQNSARRLPTPGRLIRRAARALPRLDYPPGRGCRQADWIAGMFMLFPSRAFAELGGFDEDYFLYYEDVDLCCRARLAGYDVLLDETASVTHDGLWDSHRNPRYLRWHLASMARFFSSDVSRETARRSSARETRPGWRAAGVLARAPSDSERP